MSTDTVVTLRPLRADAQRNYDHIVDVARQAFIANGTSAPLDDIACQAGVGPGTLYRHFPSRDALIVAALDTSMRELDALGRHLVTVAEPLAALRDWLVAVVKHFGTYGGLSESVARAIKDSGSPLNAACGTISNHTDAIVRRAVAAGVVRKDVASRDVFIIANTLAGAMSAGGYRLDDAERLVDLFIGGLH